MLPRLWKLEKEDISISLIQSLSQVKLIILATSGASVDCTFFGLLKRRQKIIFKTNQVAFYIMTP